MSERQLIEVPQESFSRREERALPAMQAGPTGLLQAITIAASNPSVDIEKMERLFAMHEKMVAREAEATFNDAMARAQAKMTPIVRNKANEHTRSRYADMEAINRIIVPIYSAEGLSLSYDSGRPIFGSDGTPLPGPAEGLTRTVALVSHSAGHSRVYHIDLPPDDSGSQGKVNKTKVQAAGSTNQYARRYLECMIFNLSTYDDTDGNRQRHTEEVEPDPAGKKALEACGSKSAIAKVWNGLPVEARKTLLGVRDECLARVVEADKNAAQE